MFGAEYYIEPGRTAPIENRAGPSGRAGLSRTEPLTGPPPEAVGAVA